MRFKGTTTPSQSGPATNVNEGIVYTFQNLKHTLMGSCVIHRTPPFLERGVLPLCRGYSQHIVSPANRVTADKYKTFIDLIIHDNTLRSIIMF